LRILGSIFVSSSDSYSDIWDVFFDMFNRFWPEYKGKIYLQTEVKEYAHEGLNIICTKVGKHKAFGETFRAGLNKVSENNVLLMMIDYMFVGKVKNNSLQLLYDHFCKEQLDCLVLSALPLPCHHDSAHSNLYVAEPPAGRSMFGFQMAFWHKRVLFDIVLPHENPWMAEWYGSSRAEKMQLRMEYLKDNTFKPIPYDGRGCLHQGKWLDNAVQLLKQMDYAIDYSQRGFYDDHKGYNSWKYRLKIKWIIWRTGLKGSYWDLLKCKPIH
jgi:hypothetical protein